MPDTKEKLIELIRSAVGGCATYWARLIADKLIANGVTIPVRCIDCKWHKQGVCENKYWQDAEGWYREVDNDGFCHLGERGDYE